MLWSEVIASPYLQNLPFKIELNKWGNIEMSPASNKRGKLQGDVCTELRKKKGGVVISQCSIQTTEGVKVADVAWISNALYKRLGDETPYSQCPEICVEIKSPSNSWAEMHMKASLYLAAGAKEVWIQPLDGKRLIVKPE